MPNKKYEVKEWIKKLKFYQENEKKKNQKKWSAFENCKKIWWTLGCTGVIIIKLVKWHRQVQHTITIQIIIIIHICTIIIICITIRRPRFCPVFLLKITHQIKHRPWSMHRIIHWLCTTNMDYRCQIMSTVFTIPTAIWCNLTIRINQHQVNTMDYRRHHIKRRPLLQRLRQATKFYQRLLQLT